MAQKKVFWLVGVAAIIAICFVATLRRGLGTGGGSTPGETLIGKVHQGRNSLESQVPLVSPDSKHVAYVMQRGTHSLVVLDGVEGKVYSYVEPESLTFSSDGSHLAYWASGVNAKGFAVVDGQERRPYDNLLRRSLRFSPDGHRLAYVGQKGGNQVVVLENVADNSYVEGRSYKDIKEGSIQFSPDSKRIAYWLGDDARLVLDGVEQGYGKVYKEGFSFSPDSQHVAYVALKGSQDVVVVDGTEGKQYWGIAAPRLLFSPDSKQLSYVVMSTLIGPMFLVVNGKEERRYHGMGEIVFSPDGSHLAYTAEQNHRGMVVLDGVEGKPYEDLGHLTFSPDGQHLAYIAARAGKELAIVDQGEGKEYDGIGDSLVFSPDSKGKGYDGIGDSLVFSPDSKRVAYFARRGGKWMVVVDGVEGKEYDNLAVHSLRFSPDSKRYAYGAFRGNSEMAVVDGAEHADQIVGEGPLFSPDSKHVIYIASRAEGACIVVDGVDEKTYRGFLKGSKLAMDNAGHLHALAILDAQIVRIDMKLPD